MYAVYRFMERRWRLMGIVLLIGLLLAVSLSGCKGPTINPTEPAVDPTPDPGVPTPMPTGTPTVPSGTPTPALTPTPTPAPPSYDGYADTPDDPTIKTLEVGKGTYRITMDYTGDIDWYKIAVPPNTAMLSIKLFDIPPQSDFDMIAYDANLVEFKNGRSTQAGNVDEVIDLENPGELVYLQIYAYSGRGDAGLSLTATAAETPIIDHLTYEQVLATEYPRYPRGTSSGLLERRIETKTVENVTCRGVLSNLTGTLTIGTYAHVERSIVMLTDYIDGWALAVFNGPIRSFDEMTITIGVSIASQELGLTVNVPPDMRRRGDQYVKSTTKNDVYYVAVTYGDLWASNANDIRISGGMIGSLGTLSAHNIFTQEVTVDWNVRLPDGTRCSGSLEGTPIADFESAKWADPVDDHYRGVW